MKESKSKMLAPVQEVGVNIGGASTVGWQRIEAAAAATAAESEVNLGRGTDMEGKMISVEMAIALEGTVIGDGEEIELEANEVGAEDVVVEAGALTKAGEEVANSIKILHLLLPTRVIHLSTQKQTFHPSCLSPKPPVPVGGPSQITQAHQNKWNLPRLLHPRIHRPLRVMQMLIIPLGLRILGTQMWSPSPQKGVRSRAGLTK